MIILLIVLLICTTTIAYSSKEKEADKLINLFPIRETFESLGYTVNWNNQGKSIGIYKDNINIKLVPKNNYAYINNIKTDLIVTLYNGTSYSSVDLLKELGYGYETNNNNIRIKDSQKDIIYINDKIPNFKIKDSNNRTSYIDEYKGKKKILIFGTTWCPFCIKQLDVFDKLMDQIIRDNINILLINIDSDIDKFNNILEEYNTDYSVILDTNNYISSLFKIKKVPTIVFIDENDYVLDIYEGYFDEKQIQEMITKKFTN